MIGKTSILIIVAFVLAFLCSYTILFFSQYKIQDGIPILQGDESYESQKKFYLNSSDITEKRIFLIGSSQILALNTTFIDNYITSYNEPFRVYNLATNSDHPKERANTIDMIINSKPHVVIYGIAPRDFQKAFSSSSISKPTSILPDPEEIFAKSLLSVQRYLKLDSNILESPKIIVLQDFKKITKEKNVEPEWIPYPDTFLKITNNNTHIITSEELEKGIPLVTPVTKIDTDYNEDEMALEQIITKLQNNKIKVIVFVVPESQAYLNTMPESYKDSFDSIVNNISKLNDVKIYRLDKKYSNLNVWMDPIHIAINRNTTMYSEDISKIILGEIS